MEKEMIVVSFLETNDGQVPGLPRNPRQISRERFEKLKQSIREAPEMLEMRSLIAVRRGGAFIVVCGNMRLVACRELGYKELPCHVLPEDTPAEKLREYVVKDNVGFGEMDWDIVANEWDTEEMTAWGELIPADFGTAPAADDAGAEDDGFTDEDMDNAPSVCAEGDIWTLGEHRLMCGDSTDPDAVAALMDGEEADLSVTDPPYNVNYGDKADYLDRYVGKGHRNSSRIANDNMDEDGFREFLLASFGCMYDAMRPGAALYVFHAETTGLPFRQAFVEAGFKLSQCLVWEKNAFVLGRQDYQWRHEPVLYGWKDGAAHYFVPDRTQDTVILEDEVDLNAMRKGELISYIEEMRGWFRDRTTVLYENKPVRNAMHPTMKPVALLGRLLSNSSKKGWTVLDTFGGSGSTLIAAEQLGRRCRMMEIDPHYCDVIIARWERLTGRKAGKKEKAV